MRRRALEDAAAGMAPADHALVAPEEECPICIGALLVGLCMNLAAHEVQSRQVAALPANLARRPHPPLNADVLEAPTATPCMHWFCRECLLGVLAVQPRCPMCRRDITVHQARGRKGAVGVT